MNDYMDSLSLLVSTCDKYSDTWMPFFKQLEAHWHMNKRVPIYLISESRRLNYETLEVCCLNMKPRGRVYTWSEMVQSALKRVETEYVLLMLDDFWLTEDIEFDRFERYLSFMQSASDIGFICLRDEVEKMDFCKEQVLANTFECELTDLVECGRMMPFRITTQAGIWRKSFLFQLLRSHESAWEFESRGTWRSQFLKQRVFCVKQTLIKYPYGGVLNGGCFVSDYISEYDVELTDAIIKARGLRKRNEFCKNEPPRTLSYYWRKFLSALPI